MPPEPGLKSLCCSDFTMTGRLVGGEKKKRRAPVNSSSFCQLKNRQKARAMPGDIKMPLSFRKKTGRKTFSFPLAFPLPSPPKDTEHEGQCRCQSSLDGSSSLQQDFCCLNKLICQSDIHSLKKKKKKILFLLYRQLDSNTYRWEHSS